MTELLIRIDNQDVTELRAQKQAEHRADLLADELEFDGSNNLIP